MNTWAMHPLGGPAGPVTPRAPEVPGAPDVLLVEEVAAQPRTGPGALGTAVARLPLILVTYLSKLSVPPLGPMGIGLSLPLMAATAVGGALTGRLVFDQRRLLVYILMLCTLWGIQVLRGSPYSMPSVLLMAVLHLPYVLHLRDLRGAGEAAVRFFMATATVIGVLGLLQFSLQFLIGPAFAFPIENFFPKELLISRFNSQGYLEYGSAYYRTNGVFMLEPSFFSQLIAVALVVELVTRNRRWLMALLLASLIVSYSGTGLMLLAVCLTFVTIARRRWDLILAGLVVGAALVVAGLVGEVLFLDLFIKRASEFTSKGSSGFARFVGGYYMLEEFLWHDPLRALFGQGAGSFQSFAQKATLPAGGMAVYKIIFEFGIVGAIAYFGFLYYCVVTSRAPGAMRLACGLAFLLSGIYIPFAHGMALALIVWPYSTTVSPDEDDDVSRADELDDRVMPVRPRRREPELT